MVIEIPDLAIRATAEFRWIGKDDVIGIAATTLPLDEFHRVIENPADWPVCEPCQGLVFLAPADRLPGGIDMGDLGAGLCRDQRGNAGITKQVEYLRLAAPRPDLLGHPRPMDDLLGKHAGVPERGEAAIEIDAQQPGRPGLAMDIVRKPPAAHALLVGVAGENGIGLGPGAVGKCPRPKRLRFGADDRHRPVALELFARAGIEQPISVLAGSFKYKRYTLCWSRTFAARQDYRHHRRRIALPFWARLISQRFLLRAFRRRGLGTPGGRCRAGTGPRVGTVARGPCSARMVFALHAVSVSQ